MLRAVRQHVIGAGKLNLQCLTLPANVVTRHLGYGQEDIRPFMPVRLNSYLTLKFL